MNIESFLFYIATPFLALFTIIFIYIARKASKIDEKSEKHIDDEKYRFEYKKKELSGLNNKMSSLHSVVSTDLVNPLKQVNEKINLIGVEATMDNFMNSLKEWGYTFTRTGEKAVVLLTEYADLKMSYMVSLDTSRQILIFQVFCNAFEEINEVVFSTINDFNTSTIVGHLELNKIKNLYVPMFNYSLMLNDNKISKGNFDRVYNLIAESMDTLFSEHLKIEIKITALLFTDYLKLEIGEEEYNKLIEQSNNQQAIESEKNEDEKQN